MAAIVCWGEVLWDLFPDGRRLGGAPANVAYHLAQLGAEVALVTRVGADDPGQGAIAALAAAGIDTAGVQRDPERPTGSVEVKLDGSEPRYRLVPGCAWERIACDGAAAALAAGARALIYGTLSLRAPEGRAGWRAALAAAPAGCLRVCDPNLRGGQPVERELVREALAAADVVKINDAEAETLAEVFALADPVAWLLGELGCRVVALTRGPGGCELIAAGGERVDQPGFAASPGGDNVGAGDAFTAVLTEGLLSGAPLAAIAERACRYGAHVASCRGATPPPPAWL